MWLQFLAWILKEAGNLGTRTRNFFIYLWYWEDILHHCEEYSLVWAVTVTVGQLNWPCLSLEFSLNWQCASPRICRKTLFFLFNKSQLTMEFYLHINRRWMSSYVFCIFFFFFFVSKKALENRFHGTYNIFRWLLKRASLWFLSAYFSLSQKSYPTKNLKIVYVILYAFNFFFYIFSCIYGRW